MEKVSDYEMISRQMKTREGMKEATEWMMNAEKH